MSILISRLQKNSWPWLIAGLALLFCTPLITVVWLGLQATDDNWQHLQETVLTDYLINSFVLMLGVAVGSLFLGVSSAWLTSMCRFPGRSGLQWALLLPLAMPAYIVAYTYTGLLDFAGPVQTLLRESTGWGYGDYWFPEIRSLGGAIVVMSLVLYPYVYLMARAAFLEQSLCVIEVSRSLGNTPWQSFVRVALPLARPAIVAGLSLALMETLADYGTVAYFGVDVFTTGIFRTWFGMGDSASAARLASLLLVFVFTLVMLERVSRRKARYHLTSNRLQHPAAYVLSGWKAWLALSVCGLPVLLGFLLPAAQLAHWSWLTRDLLDSDFAWLTLNSFALALGASVLALALALVLGYGRRILPRPLLLLSSRVAAMGYAIPGTVVAVGIIIPLAWFDNQLDAWMRAQFDISTGLLLSGTVFALLFAYSVRFLAVSLQSVEAGLGKIRPSMDDAARSLGYRASETLWKIHMPLMRRSLLTALLIVFVDVMKELPATLILRPFNFNTLAVRAFELASDERLAESASAALMIVMAGLIPVILLSRSISTSKQAQ